MQLYAKTAPNTTKKETIDPFSALISAEQAQRRCDYFCPECGRVVRVRAGEQRLKHFYHLAKSAHCPQQNKSLEHILTQRFIQQAIGPACLLEVAFPAIARIADAVWEEEKLIFEVQCSPMTAAVGLARIADYAKAGYQVVFILHDKRFNQYRVTALEAALSKHRHPFYFTNISAAGEGMIYDQFGQVGYGLRLKRLAKLPIMIQKPLRLLDIDKASLFFKSHLYFQDDLFYLAQNQADSSYIQEALEHIARGELRGEREGEQSSFVGKAFARVSLKFLVKFLWHKLLSKCAAR